jgi:hypothetical protein
VTGNQPGKMPGMAKEIHFSPLDTGRKPDMKKPGIRK